MAVFRARQVARIRDAVAAGREALRRAGDFDPLRFARAFVAAGGPQVPDAPPEAGEALGERLLRALAAGQRHAADDPDLERELQRVRTEARWAEAQDDDQIVGFLLRLPSAAEDSPTAEALAHQSQGLGPGVFRKGDIVVLQPECDGARFVPVSAHEVEC